jgi:hypothetical protein
MWYNDIYRIVPFLEEAILSISPQMRYAVLRSTEYFSKTPGSRPPDCMSVETISALDDEHPRYVQEEEL